MRATVTIGSELARRFTGENRQPRPAIEYRGKSIGNLELEGAAQWIADQLARLGLRPGAHVGILANNASLVIPSLIGVMAGGGVFALLDPSHPSAHLRTLIEAADLACLIVEDSLVSFAEQALSGIQRIIRIDASIFAEVTIAPTISSRLAQSTALASYLCFTSGTTGTPKAILGRADSLLRFIDWEISTLGLNEYVRVSQLTSPSHDPFLRDIFVPLIAGGTICIPDNQQVVLSPQELGQWLDNSRIQLVHCTPTVFRNLCKGGLSGHEFQHLKHVLLAGEQLRGSHLAAWYRAFGDRIQLINLYGPTETTLAKLAYVVSPQDVTFSAVPIGQPIDDATVRIVPAKTQRESTNEIGELYIETEFPSLGYYKQAEHNREVFSCDPTRSIGKRIEYKTGDLVSRLPNGNIEFIGRIDRQQKVRGKQVALGRVEDEIVSRTEIESCTVLVDEGTEDTPDRLVAFYVADQDFQEKSLKQSLDRELPSAHIPDVWIRIDALPINVHGKVDRFKLTAILKQDDLTRCSKPSACTNNQSDTEDRLLELWKELLRTEQIKLDDLFMEVGGDSLSIMLLIARLEQDFAYNLSLWQVFDNLTITKLAALIDENDTQTTDGR